MQFSNPSAIFNYHHTTGATVDTIHIFSAVSGNGTCTLTFALYEGGDLMQLDCHDAEMHGVSTRNQAQVKQFILDSIESAMYCEMSN